MKKLLTPVKVGFLAILAMGGFFYAVHQVQQGGLGGGDTYGVSANLKNVLGLAKRSRVVMAGIDVGYIDGIELMKDGRAKLKLRIKDDVQLYRDASLSKVSESLLGDKLITLNAGQDTDHPLADGGQILDDNVHEGTEMSAVFDKLDQITSNINDVTVSLKKMIGNIEREDALGGVMTRMKEIADNVAQLTERVNNTVVKGSKQIDQILADVAGVTGGTRERYNEILDNVTTVSGDVRKLVKNLNDIVGQGGEDWKESVGGLKATLDKASRSLDNLDQITRKINEGQGTVGRLINDDRVLSKAEGVLDDVSSITGGLGRLRTEIDLHTEYNIRQSSLKNYLALKLIPKSDKYYMVEVIDDPRGSVQIKNWSWEEKVDGVPSTGKRKETKVTDKFKFSVEFFKRYYFLGLRFGIIENSGGLGANFFLFNDDLELKLDLFQFGTNEYGEKAWPRLRTTLVYKPTWLANHIYLAAGADDYFNMHVQGRQLPGSGQNTFDYFFGAGIHFDDEDLKSIFTVVGAPKP